MKSFMSVWIDIESGADDPDVVNYDLQEIVGRVDMDLINSLNGNVPESHNLRESLFDYPGFREAAAESPVILVEFDHEWIPEEKDNVGRRIAHGYFDVTVYGVWAYGKPLHKELS